MNKKTGIKKVLAMISAMSMLCTATTFLPYNIFSTGTAITASAEEINSDSWLEVSSAENNYKKVNYTASDGKTYPCYVCSVTENKATLISVQDFGYNMGNGKRTYEEQVEHLKSMGARMPKVAEYRMLAAAGHTYNSSMCFNASDCICVYYENNNFKASYSGFRMADYYYHASFDIYRNPITAVSDSLAKSENSPELSTVKGVDFTWQGDCEIELTYYNADKVQLDKAPSSAGKYYVKASTPLVIAEEDDETIRYEQSESDYILFEIHRLTHNERKEASCEENGNIEYWHCSECGKYFSDSKCEKEISLSDTILYAIRHKNLVMFPMKEPTCTEDGNIQYEQCILCGKYFTDVNLTEEITLADTILPKNHSIVHIDGKEPSCTENGWSDYYQCEVCGEFFNDSEGKSPAENQHIPEISSGGHFIYLVEERKEPTCTEDGHTDIYTCAWCGKYFDKFYPYDYEWEKCDGEIQLSDTVIPAGHNLTHMEKKTSNCTETGNIEYWYCSDCDKYFKDSECQTEITLADTIINTYHNNIFVKYYPATEPTCTKPGYPEYWFCLICKKYFSDKDLTIETTFHGTTISPRHSNVTYTARKESTYTETGNIEYWHCSDCDMYFVTEDCNTSIQFDYTILPIKHDTIHIEEKNSTCTKTGNIEYWYCPDCDKYFKDSEYRTEITLSDTVTSTINHVLKHYSKVSPKCYIYGNIEYWQCYRCNKYFADEDCVSELSKNDLKLSALGHSDTDNNGYCDRCKWIMPVKIKEVSATLDGDIGMNYYISLPDYIKNDDSYVKFTVNGKSTKVMVKDITPEADGTYKFTYRMNAKEMYDKIKLEVYDSYDSRLELYSSADEKIEGNGFEYSLAEYFNVLSSDTSVKNENLVNLAKTTLAYGAFAQRAFGHNVDTTNSDIDISDVTVDTLESHRMTKTGEMPEGLKLSEMTLILESETTLCLYFYADDMEKYSFVLDNNSVTPADITGENMYCIKIADISAKDLDKMHTLVINDNCMIAFDALSYAYSVVKTGKNDAVCDVVKALYKYNETANKYFNN